MDKKTYLSIVSALATATAVWLFALLAAPIATPLAWALIIGISTRPHYERLLGKVPGQPNRAAGLMVITVTVCFVLPVAALLVMVAQNAAEWYSEAERLVLEFKNTGASTLGHLPFVKKLTAQGERFGIDLADFGAKLAEGTSGYMLDIAANTAKGLGEFFFTLAVALFILFFIYRDGERLVAAAVARFAPDQEQAHHYLSEIRATTTAVTVGTIFTCLIQGITAGLGYYVAGVPAPVLCGGLTALAALVPVVGTGIIWVPLAALIAMNGAYLKAGLLVLWCALFVVFADNAIRPLAIGAKSNIPVPAIVLGAISGVLTLGILGLILGPVLFAILFIVWRDLTDPGQVTADKHAP